MSIAELYGKLTEKKRHRLTRAVVLFVAFAAVYFLLSNYIVSAQEQEGSDTSPGITGEQIKIMIFSLLGGIALLIYGIHRMGEGLQKAMGDRMRDILGRLTDKPVHGVMVGAGVTALIQSSSATTVMVVGFVNAGLMTLVQAVGVILGANIGTTITGQLIAFKLTDLALPITAIGVAIHFFSRRKMVKHIGLFIVGFGILFIGLNIMKEGVHFLRDSERISPIFREFGEKPILGVLAGMIMTALAQSSSATIGVVISMVSLGALSLGEAVPIILGDNIGTCITAGLASIGSNRNAKRAALAHVLFNVIGTIVILTVLQQYLWLISHTAVSPERQTANAHTIFNVLNMLVFLPFVPLFAKFVERILPGQTEDRRQAIFLEEKLLLTPAIALDQSINEITRTMGFVSISLRSIEKTTRLGGLRFLDDIDEDEEIVDDLHRQIVAYVVNISEKPLSSDISEKIPVVLHTIDDIERIGDNVMMLKKLLEQKDSSKVDFSEEALEELISLQDLVNEDVEEVQRALSYRDKSIAKGVVGRKDDIENLTRQMRAGHIDRLCSGSCHVQAGVFFLEMVKRYEAISYRCQNIAEAVVDYLGDDDT